MCDCVAGSAAVLTDCGLVYDRGVTVVAVTVSVIVASTVIFVCDCCFDRYFGCDCVYDVIATLAVAFSVAMTEALVVVVAVIVHVTVILNVIASMTVTDDCVCTVTYVCVRGFA